jgi:hypothetical protein
MLFFQFYFCVEHDMETQAAKNSCENLNESSMDFLNKAHFHFKHHVFIIFIHSPSFRFQPILRLNRVLRNSICYVFTYYNISFLLGWVGGEIDGYDGMN